MSGYKLANLKQALTVFVKRLREKDVLSITVFDDNASVLINAQKIDNKFIIQKSIEGIAAGGSTNLHGGLMLGYNEVLKNFRKNATNRVILLTDGIANKGVTDPEDIIKGSKEFNEKNVSLSVIGLGNNLDIALLRQLAKSGKGLIHFVGDNEDITKIFIDELESLLSPKATNVNLEIEYDPELEITDLYGYSPKFSKNRILFELDDMNAGLTQLVILKFNLKEGKLKKQLPVKVKLKYYDLVKKQEVIKEGEIKLVYDHDNSGSDDILIDEVVKKNYTIANMSKSIKEMARASKNKEYTKAQSVLYSSMSETMKNYPDLEDMDIVRVLDMMKKYSKVLDYITTDNSEN
jgi:hypothetical protein